MLLTSKDANKLLKQLNSELDSLKRQEGRNKLFPAANIEDVEAVRPEYDYRAIQKKINEIEEKIVRVKHAINKFNVETVVPEFNKTIDEMLVYIPQLSARKIKLWEMKDVPKMERAPQFHGANIIDYTRRNYDAAEVEEDYRNIEAELTKAQIALDRINISETFEIEI